MATILAKGPAPLSRGAMLGESMGAALGTSAVKGFEDARAAQMYDPVREALTSAMAGIPANNPVAGVLQSITSDPRVFAQVMQKPQQLQALTNMGSAMATKPAEDPFPELSEIKQALTEAAQFEAAGDVNTAGLLRNRAASVAGLDPNKPGVSETLIEMADAMALADQAEAGGNPALANMYRDRAMQLSGKSPSAYSELDEIDEAVRRAEFYASTGDTQRADYFNRFAADAAGMSPEAMTELQRNIASIAPPGTPENSELMRQAIFGRQTMDQRQQRIANLASQGIPENIAANFVDGFAEMSTNPTTGQVEIVDAITGERHAMNPASAGALRSDAALGPAIEAEPMTGAQGDTLWDLSEIATGRGAAARVGIGKVVGLISGMNPTEKTTYARARFSQEIQGLIRSLAINDRFPVSEQERIRKDIAIVPNVLLQPNEMRARMQSVATGLTRDAENYWALANRPGLDQSTRESYANASLSIQNFLKVLGVPPAEQPAAAAPSGSAASELSTLSDEELLGF